MSARGSFRLWCGASLPFVLWVAAVAADKSVVENYDDGAKKFSYTVNAAGAKEGAQSEFYPSGKRRATTSYNNGKKNGSHVELFESGKVRLRTNYLNDELNGKYVELNEAGGTVRTANYRNGQRHGAWQEFDGKTLVKDEFYGKDILLIPRLQAQIAAKLAQLNKATIVTDGEVPADVSADIKRRVLDPSAQADREAAVRNLNGYRYLCGLPSDVGLSRAHNAYAEAGSDLLKAIGKLDHTPANPGMPEDVYKAGYKGTSSCNIFSGQKDMSDTVHGYMNDSDKSNIDRVGHRRWCLNPKMSRTGFGLTSGFSAMWAMDGDRTEAFDYDYTAFPPPGLVPNAVFKKDYAWSVTPNPDKYKLPEQAKVKVRVFPAKLNPATADLEKACAAAGVELLRRRARRLRRARLHHLPARAVQRGPRRIVLVRNHRLGNDRRQSGRDRVLRRFFQVVGVGLRYEFSVFRIQFSVSCKAASVSRETLRSASYPSSLRERNDRFDREFNRVFFSIEPMASVSGSRRLAKRPISTTRALRAKRSLVMRHKNRWVPGGRPTGGPGTHGVAPSAF
ncbi:MAG: hypothetical protein QM811_15330 [Pirellulales bacterium]